jgi:predicted acylesterase/phospholipase RssA
MQGGITSGVAYPAAVMELCRHFRFRSIGGASAGAMAAAVTAAAEYARDSGGFERLEALRMQLRRPGLIAGLFNPSREAAPLFRILLAAQAKRTEGARTVSYVLGVVRWLFWPALLAGALAFGLGVAMVHSASGTLGDLGVWGWIVFALGILVTAALGLTIAFACSVSRLLRRLPRNYFGMCMGAKRKPKDADALTDWLHRQIQTIAGRSVEDPLTFADLSAKGINLKLMTTDVTGGRPVRMPIEAGSGVNYLFNVDELRPLLPAEVIGFLDRATEVVYEGPSELRAFPDSGLPIVVATRMSLTFPLLLSAVPLWTVEGDRVTKHWFADGGISSNFPIQLFDAWLPTRPTFGLYFGRPLPKIERGGPPKDAKRVPDDTGLFGYLTGMLHAGLNWHDTMQSALPGFRERIQPITLTDGQGGFNLTMPPEMIKEVDEKGVAAGQVLAGFDFHQHWLERYAIAMRMLQRNLVRPDNGRVSFQQAYTGEYGAWFAAGAPGSVPPDGMDVQWCGEAADATGRLLSSAGAWLPTAGTFVDGQDPTPSVAMRITPDI